MCVWVPQWCGLHQLNDYWVTEKLSEVWRNRKAFSGQFDDGFKQLIPRQFSKLGVSSSITTQLTWNANPLFTCAHTHRKWDINIGSVQCFLIDWSEWVVSHWLRCWTTNQLTGSLNQAATAGVLSKALIPQLFSRIDEINIRCSRKEHLKKCFKWMYKNVPCSILWVWLAARNVLVHSQIGVFSSESLCDFQ